MGGSASKDGKVPSTPRGDRPEATGGAAKDKPKGEPLITQKFGSFHSEQKSEPGFGADDDDNQDVMISTALQEDVQLYAMFDGHGHEGRLVSDACKECVLDVLAANLKEVDKEKDVVKEELKSAILELNKKVTARDDVDTSQSGASVTLVIYDVKNKGLLVGNVGDTKLVVAKNKPGARRRSRTSLLCSDISACAPDIAPRTSAPSPSPAPSSLTLSAPAIPPRPGCAGEKSLKAQMLTEDHYPGVATEKARIEASGGRVAATEDVQLGELGGQRVWKGTSDKPGLPLSRSIGDKMAKELGVTAEAALNKVSLTAEDRFLVLASGGIWKVFSPQEVVDLVAQQPDAASACDALVKEASKRWEELWQGENTSVMVVVLPTA